MTSTREIVAAQAALAAADRAATDTGPGVPMAHGFPSTGLSPEQFDKLVGLLEPIAEVNILMLPMIRAQVAAFEADQAKRLAYEAEAKADEIEPDPAEPPPVPPPPPPPAEPPPAPDTTT